MDEARMKTNGAVIALFFMQYTLLIPLMQFVDSTLIVAVSSITIIIYYFFKNGSIIVETRLFVFYAVMLLLFVVKIVISQAELSSLLYVVMFTLPAMVIFFFPFSYKAFVDSIISLSRLGFVLIFWVPFLFNINYMRFGYGMLPIVMAMYISIFYFKKQQGEFRKSRTNTIDKCILVLSFIEMLLYGARGCLVAFVIFFVIDRFLINKTHIIPNLLFLFVISFLGLNLVTIVELAEKLSKKIGLYSYAITKYKMQLSGGFEYASSGRVRIYSNAIEKIRVSPIFGGHISLDESGGAYAHNIFLQMGEDFGVFAMIALLCFVVYALVLIGKRKGSIDEKVMLMVLFSSAIGRLMFSSTIWRRPEFWMLVALVISLNRNRYYSELLLQEQNEDEMASNEVV